MKRLLLILFIPQFSNGQIITTIAGNGIAGYINAVPVTNAEFNGPESVKLDHSGNMYIADHNNHVVRKISSSGIITTIAGTGTKGYSGDGGPATNAELNFPLDLAFDATGNLYVSHEGNSAIRRITPSGIISTFAGTGVSGDSGDNGPATAAQLNDPLGLVFDNAGNLYFSDNFNHRIRKINTAGIISTIAGSGTLGYGGDGLPATQAQIRYGGFICFGPSGDLYIPDYANNRIRKVDASGIITTVIGNGTNANTGDGGPATAATISEMWSVLFDKAGNMYLTDINGYSIRKVDASGIITTIAGTGTGGYCCDGGPATNAQFGFETYCSALDASGNLYIADYTNNRIRRITLNATDVNEVNKTKTIVSIYPNPSATSLTITSGNPITNVIITNLVGQTVYKNYFNNKDVQVNVADLPTGIYLVRINDTEVRKFVKE